MVGPDEATNRVLVSDITYMPARQGWRYLATVMDLCTFHSDRGSQYASEQFRDLLCRHGAAPSMRAKGNCYDNAAMESFRATLKSGMGMNEPFETQEDARLGIFDYIEVFCNRQRLHSALGYRSPLDCER